LLTQPHDVADDLRFDEYGMLPLIAYDIFAPRMPRYRYATPSC